MLFVNTLIFIIPILIVLWIIVEIEEPSKFSRLKRIMLGAGIFLLTGICAWDIASMGTTLRYKVRHGGAINKLINTVIDEIENNNEDVLVEELKKIKLVHSIGYNEQIDTFCNNLENSIKVEKHLETLKKNDRKPND